MNYPPDFPSQSRARVEAEKIRAEADFYAAVGSASLLSEIKAPLRECISRSFLAFAREACTRRWSVDKIDAKCCDFLCLLAIDAHQRGYDLWSGSLFLSLTWDQLRPRVKREFLGTAQWQQYNELLLKVAEAKSAVVPESAEPSAVQLRKLKRGRKANMESHRAIAEVVRPYGSNWKEESNLEGIAEELDKRKLPCSSAWAKRDRPARSWRRAVEFYPEIVRKALDHSLKMADRENPRKSSEILADLR